MPGLGNVSEPYGALGLGLNHMFVRMKPTRPSFVIQPRSMNLIELHARGAKITREITGKKEEIRRLSVGDLSPAGSLKNSLCYFLLFL